MQNPRNLSWNQFNESRRFPLLYNCSATSDDGHFIIPDDLLVSLYISYRTGTPFANPGTFYIGELVYYRTGFSLSIFYRTDDDIRTRVAETSVDFTADPIPTTASLLGVNTAFLNGYIVLGEMSGLEKQPAGEWTFSPEATTIDPFCIRLVAQELSALYVRNDTKTVGPFYGDVILRAGDAIKLDVRTVDNLFNCLDLPVSDIGTEVIVSALPETSNDTTPAIRTINNVRPDANGNINFVGRACLNIMPQGTGTLIFEDKCSEPCCTCTELVPIEEKNKELQKSVGEVASRMDNLTTQVDFLAQSLSTFR
jgi:hypothetical protein